MPCHDSHSQSRIQIEQAAAGCISGTLSEWPHLKHALRERGYRLSNAEPAASLAELCRTICRTEGWKP